MRALDTNVLARFFVDDADDAQAAKLRPAAVAALSERSFVSVTVLLELEWVMRGFYELPKRDIVRVLRALAPMATSNSPTCGHSNSPRQDGRIMGFLTLCELIARVRCWGAA